MRIYKQNKRNDSGFTLSFALVLTLMFAGLLYMSFYLLGLNIKYSSRDIFKSQAIYLAESGNNRAICALNVKSLPEIEEDDELSEDEEDEFDEFDEFFDDEEFDEFFDDEELEDLDFDEDNETLNFLAEIPRYINFWHEEPYYVNIDSGNKVTEAGYFALIAEQNARIQQARAENPDLGQRIEIPIQELYFPLPEVNVKKIGTIPVPKGMHLKPGFRVVLAERSTTAMKQKDIVNEYTNYIPPFQEPKLRPIVREISPNYGYADELLDIRIDGENIEEILPEISTSDIALLEYYDGLMAVDINAKAKAGRYTIKIGPHKAQFYIVPPNTEGSAPRIGDIRLTKERDGQQQFIKMFNRDSVDIIITGEDLSDGKPPIIVPDGRGILVDIKSYSKRKITCTITTEKAKAGSHFITVYTKGGSSSSWIFNVEKTVDQAEIDPFTGSYSTVLTLLEIKSLSNLPISQDVDASPQGRPGNSGGPSGRPGSGGGSGRPGGNQSLKNKKFDLLRSDLDTAWKVETIASVNKYNYKETKILRRSAPRANAALITNTGFSFGQSSMVIEGMLEASTFLEEAVSIDDTEITVEGRSAYEQELYQDNLLGQGSRNQPTGSAVVEDFGLGLDAQIPSGKGFEEGGIIAINSSQRGSGFSDYAIVQTMSSNTITVEEPGFQQGHFVGDEVVQFIPAVISPFELNERDASRSLNPPGAAVRFTGQTGFDYVFRTRLDRIEEWSQARTTSTKVPNGSDDLYEGYFGLNIVEGTPDYTGSNALYGQGALIVDTTEGGFNPSGGTVTIGGGSKLPSIFSGLIYIIGKLQIVGNTEIAGAIIVHSPSDGATTRIGGRGNISYNPNAINKAILDLPFTAEPRSRKLEKSGSQDTILKKKKVQS